MRFAAPTMPKARARLEPTTSITVAPTTARTICVSITGADRGGVPRRRGRNASAAPRTVAIGSESTARSTMSKCDTRTCGSDSVSSAGGGCMSCAWKRSARRLVGRPRAQRDRIVNLLLQLREEAVRVAVGVIRRAEGVVPLPVGEPRQVFAGPLHVGRVNHRNQFLMPSDIVELDVLAVDGGDEAVLLEAFETVAARIHLAGLAERGAEITHDEPVLRAFHRLLELVDAVVVVLQIRAVEHQQDDQQPVQFVRADQRVLLPPPVLVE